HIGGNRAAGGREHLPDFVLQADFGLDALNGDAYRSQVCIRVFGLQPSATDASLAAAITNGTAPGLYVREGDDTSNWGAYREVLARRVEEAMAARRGGVVEVDTTATVTSPLIRECHWCHNSRRITRSQDDERRICSYCFDWPEVAQARRDAAALAAARAMPTATTRQGDEIRVGDVVEVVSYDGPNTIKADIGRGGRVSHLVHGVVYLNSIDGMRLPVDNVASLADVRKVTSSSPSITVAANVSPMPDAEAARIEAAVSDEVRRQMSSPLASGGDEVTIRHVVNPAPPARSVRLQSRDFTTASITEYLQSLGATHIHINRTLEGVPVIEVTGLLQQALDTARQNLPAGVQLRAAVPAAEAPRRITAYDRWSSNVPQSSPQPQPRSPTPPQPSRFSLLEVDVDAGSEAASPPQALKASVDLGALQAELRAEREAKRALAAAQTPQGRFDLLECDLPAVPAVAVESVKTLKRPVVSPPPPKPLSPVETITDLTTARSPLELARMLAGLDEELSTMMRQREVN
nr:hypothetical protein [bacterium]